MEGALITPRGFVQRIEREPHIHMQYQKYVEGEGWSWTDKLYERFVFDTYEEAVTHAKQLTAEGQSAHGVVVGEVDASASHRAEQNIIPPPRVFFGATTSQTIFNKPGMAATSQATRNWYCIKWNAARLTKCGKAS